MTRNDGPPGPFFLRKRKTAVGEALLFSFGLLQSALAKKGEENAWPPTVSMQSDCVCSWVMKKGRKKTQPN